ncbi:MAG: hypothetical protein K8T91_07470 [Planctomycetes bacterium]|nr:hypothetical protein [Planctomycetota bacterium]
MAGLQRARRFANAIVVGCLSAVGLAAFLFSMPSADRAAAAPPAQPANAIKVNALDYCKEFKDNEQAAIAKYSKGTVEVTGKFYMFNVEPEGGRPTITALLAGETKYTVVPDLSVKCQLKDKSPWLKLTPGREVTLRGTLAPPTGEYFRDALVDCVVVSPNAGSTPELKAVDLGAEYAANKQAFEKKYDNRCIVVEGPVVEIVDRRWVKVGDAKQFVTLSMTGFDADHLKVGEKVAALGFCSVVSRSNTPVQISNAKRIELYR